MSEQYRTCQNCGASLAPGQTYCARCGAPYVEPIIQQPGVLPPSQPGTPYPPQGQGYAQPYVPSSYPPEQAQMAAGQEGGSPEAPPSQTGQGLRISLIIGAVVLLLLLLGGVGGLFYYLGRSSAPATPTPVPGITPTPTPGITPTPTPTPGITPTLSPASFRVPAADMRASALSIHNASGSAASKTSAKIIVRQSLFFSSHLKL